MGDVTALSRQRGSIKSSCTRIQSYVDAVTDIDADVIAHVEERRHKLDEYWAQYNEVQTRLEAIDGTAEVNDRIQFEEAFYTVCARMKRILHQPSVAQEGSRRSPSMDNRSYYAGAHIRLPKLNLPTFAGQCDE
ncbi:hypothetical protein KM043_014473 [Ampulex compressa]|nr:hypothetical protein KM043_014473 [Ampulex compressa]